jgi:hypothetical protein
VRCWERGGLTIKAERVGELWVVQGSGMLTSAGFLWICDLLQMLLQEEDARAFVLNLQESILVSVEWWTRGPEKPMQVPVAIVVSPVWDQMIRRYCLVMAKRGVARGPFIGELAALAWAAEQREHWPHRPQKAPQPRRLPVRRSRSRQAAAAVGIAAP